MKIRQNPIVLVFITFAFALSAKPQDAMALPKASLCSYYFMEVLEQVSPGRFDFLSFLDELGQQKFKDRFGEEFQFYSRRNEDRGFGVVSLSVKHSRLGDIDEEYDSLGIFDRLYISKKGDFEGGDWRIDYGPYKSRGFLTSFFEFTKKRLPDGSQFHIHDASITSKNVWRIYSISDAQMDAAIRSDSSLAEFYKIYEQIISLPSFKRVYSSIQVSLRRYDRTLPDFKYTKYTGFKRYLADLTTVWGRVARKGNYRRDYLYPEIEIETIFMKRTIPEEILNSEDALLRSPEGQEALKKILHKKYKRVQLDDF